ncbi:MAG TPA: sulfatase-like hydrolase/transferase [Candidatus Avacidaminococcus intestinavium]|uniref:Sulfatase-like hydrolase/transferase n=1 Tax=Candidatus Avacidaminococcus intestinavium TaxID=2840684 RepID=A0A9D1MPR5_9FIRM|nr:sulfatase-like hydrolase/transferase [Candidatus Avacidaminococcus intestinavium]
MYKKIGVFFLIVFCLALELFISHVFYQAIVPFPIEEFWFTALNFFLRDLLLIGVGFLLYKVRKRIRDRVKRYFPIVVVGIGYLAFAFFMVNYLKLDWGVLTVLAVLAGLNNNIFFVLLSAMCYHKWPGKLMKAIYFLVYFGTCLIMLFDGIYFWTTSMHIESVLFRNLNYYSIKGVLETSGLYFILGLLFIVICYVLLFRVSKPTKKKPNFAWSLFCLALFTLVLNFSYLSLSTVVRFSIQEFGGLWSEAEIEATRHNYRNAVAVPVNVNFVAKGLFDTDDVAKKATKLEDRELSVRDKEILLTMGIEAEKKFAPPPKAAYDKVVVLMLESVHRDFMHFYNPAIPAEATPFLDYLLEHYPHLNRYYSSSIPTTEGINSVLRSRLLFDRDKGEPDNLTSLYKQVSAYGWRGIFMNASSGYYSNEFRQYPAQFGMKEYYAREYLEERGYTGASGWGFHNDIMYEETLKMLERGRHDKLFMITKTLDMHQPYPYYGLSWAEMPETVRDNKFVTVRGIYWVNYTLEYFFKEIERRGLMDDRTLFIITSDHNPHSGGEYKELVTNEAETQSIAAIPMIFIAKNLTPFENLREDDFASSIDLAPTLLPLMGMDTPSDFLGRNLLEFTAVPFALGYFGGKAYYFSDRLSFVDKLDNPYPSTPEEDALANFIAWSYARDN